MAKDVIQEYCDFFSYEEGKWMDEFLESVYPAWLWKLTKFSVKHKINTLIYILARTSGLRIERSQVIMELSSDKGLLVSSISVKIFKKNKIIAERKFILNLVINNRGSNR